jgi:hypothetical protein
MEYCQMNKSIAGLLLTLIASASLMTTGAQAEVYKIVDKDGNVIYTDQPPEPGAEPVELPGLSVIGSLPGPAPKAEVTGDPAEEQVTDIRELRRGYKDFRITSPAQEEHIQGTGNAVTLSWDARYALQPGMVVIFTLDGTDLEPTVSPSLSLQEIDRGEHTVSARLVDSQARIIASASPVTFFMRQWSQNFLGPNRPTPTIRR